MGHIFFDNQGKQGRCSKSLNITGLSKQRFKTVAIQLLFVVSLLLPAGSYATEFDIPNPDLSRSIEQLSGSQKNQIPLGVKRSRSLDGHGKLGSIMQALVAQRKFPATHTKAALRSRLIANTRSGGRAQVYLSLRSVDDSQLGELRDLGVEIEIVNTELNKVQAWLGLDLINEITALDFVDKITSPKFGRSRSGASLTQGDSILKADQLRQLGFTGQGIKVGIISDGANDWTTARNSSDLPNQLTLFGSCTKESADPQNCSPASDCNEGTAMAEIIHDIAPDAELAVAAVSTSLEFIQRLNQLADDFKADIIVDDLGFLGEPYFEDGDLAQAVSSLPKNVLYVSAAGNGGFNHYENNFQRLAGIQADFHDFGAVAGEASFEGNGFIVPPDQGVVTILQWNERFATPSSDYDLFISDETAIIDGSTADQVSGAEAIEATCSYNPSSQDLILYALVNKFSGADRRLEMFFLGAPAIQYNVPGGSIVGHPGVPRAVAVGAINASEPGNNEIAFYSSRGPAIIDFPATQSRAKPDIIAIDGVTVSGAGGFPSTFFGTSAAAPHVAGIAAQLMSSSPFANADKVRQALIGGAVDLGVSGHDSLYGFGRADALLAKAALKAGNPLPAIIMLLGEEGNP